MDTTYETAVLKQTSELLKEAYEAVNALSESIDQMNALSDFEKKANFVRDDLLSKMAALRKPCDELEVIVDEKDWPFPTYGKLLFGVM